MGGNENTKTAAPKVRGSPSKRTKGAGGRKYADDTKCSIDVGAKNRRNSDEGGVVPRAGPVRGAKFEKGGGEKAKSTSEVLTPKDAKSRACYKWMERVLEGGVKTIRLEWLDPVKAYITPKSKSISELPKNAVLNRYDDVTCIDDTRIVIKDNPEEDGDYINGNFVKVNSDLTYICTQAPLGCTTHHFWLMVVQEKVKVILQLCQLKEKGQEKCDEYYPSEQNKWKSYGCAEVRVTEVNRNVAGMKKVIKSKMQVKINDKNVHDLTHIFYSAWPDHGAPESVGSIVAMRNLVHRTCEKKPIVAHCSAGIGRTGCFVMIELMAHYLLDKNEGDLKPIDMIKELRDQRSNAIQNDVQYVFVYRCVMEILLAEGLYPKTPEVTNFIESYESFIQRKKKALEKRERKKGGDGGGE